MSNVYKLQRGIDKVTSEMVRSFLTEMKWDLLVIFVGNREDEGFHGIPTNRIAAHLQNDFPQRNRLPHVI
jgi:hypothetical protein